MNNKGPGNSVQMPTPQGMPPPMNLDMGQMNQFPGNMMMPNQMPFSNQQMFMDPNFMNQQL